MTKDRFLLELEKCFTMKNVGQTNFDFTLSDEVERWLDSNNIKYERLAEYNNWFDTLHCGLYFENYDDIITFKMMFPEYVKKYYGKM